MSNTDQAPEPSMEEILASIRKIISDDETDDTAASAGEEESISADTGEAKESEEFAATIPESEPDPEPETDPDADMMAEDVMAKEIATEEVTEEEAASFAMEEEEEESDLSEEFAPASTEEVPVEEAFGEGEDSILELTEEVDIEDENTDTEFETASSEDNAEPADEKPVPDPADMIVTGGEDDVFFAEEEEKEEELAEVVAEPVAAPVQTDGLLSNNSGDSIASAFGSLENLVLSTQSRTIEDLIQSMLRPMLREWLDGNLPPLVERLVRDEIERVSRGRR